MAKILVTGMSGLVGSALAKRLSASHELSALNRSDVAEYPTTRASLGDFDAICPAFEGVDTVIHLAAKIDDSFGWDDLHDTNVVGTRNVFEAAAHAGVRRIVFASSGAVVAGWELVEPYRSLVAGEYENVPERLRLIDETMAVRPRNLYAATKVWGEAIARHYADNHGLEITCLRIGFANAEDRPSNARQFSVWNSQRDVVRAFELALDYVPPERFDVFFILSDNRRGYRNITRAKTLLGFEPVDSADDFSQEVLP
ncbi:MAG: NAD(P)-dependent oxidoreductase [Pseudomonadales bacterium]|nr:NAD(P)-dependent oxidoreductase [Pseudomonadales bacterium]